MAHILTRVIAAVQHARAYVLAREVPCSTLRVIDELFGAADTCLSRLTAVTGLTHVLSAALAGTVVTHITALVTTAIQSLVAHSTARASLVNVTATRAIIGLATVAVFHGTVSTARGTRARVTQQVAGVRTLGAFASLGTQFTAAVRQVVRVVFGVFGFVAETTVFDFFIEIRTACWATPFCIFFVLERLLTPSLDAINMENLIAASA